MLTDQDPDYVVLGGDPHLQLRAHRARRSASIVRGARFIATNPDPDRPVAGGPSAGDRFGGRAHHRASGVDPYFVGKPNPLMMRSALNAIDAHSETAAMVGDRMDTDVVSGLEAGMQTVLVLTGITPVRKPSGFRTGRQGSSTRSPI